MSDFFNTTEEGINKNLGIKTQIENFERGLTIFCEKEDFTILIKAAKQCELSFMGAFCTHYIKNVSEFMLTYMFLSYKENKRLKICVKIDQDTDLDSASSEFSGAIWYEREIFDMFGVKFLNLKDHRRILTDYGFSGHPLRKDFPVTGFKEVFFDPFSKNIEYKDVKFEQNYRKFENTMEIDPSSLFEKLKNAK